MDIDLISSLKLRAINLIMFPDWLQEKEILIPNLEKTMRTLICHPQVDYITLLIDTSNIDIEDAEIIFSQVMLHMIMKEDLNTTEKLEISFFKDLNTSQWETLSPYIQAKIALEYENQEAIAKARADELDEIVAE